MNAGAHVTLRASLLNYGKGLPLSEACGSMLKCLHESRASGEGYPGYPWEPTPLDLTRFTRHENYIGWGWIQIR